jgi:UDP-glucuronate decarboxylase
MKEIKQLLITLRVLKKIVELLDYPYFEMVRHDITEPYYAEDEIYNLVCPASPVHYQCNPNHKHRYSAINVLGLANVKAKVASQYK